MEDRLPFEKIKREILVRKESSSGSYGVNPYERNVDKLINYGVICLNKVQGPSSHQVADYVKKILDLKRCGHGGTLDPNVTGVLPIATGRATRIVQALLNAGKEYVCLMILHKELSEKEIFESVTRLTGKIQQLPPVKSAIKRQLRTREIYYLNILEINGKNVLFKVGCEAGTYIRKLVFDWGKNLGTQAHMQELIRTKAGPFSYKEWVSLHDLKDAYEFYKEGDDTKIRECIKPIEKAVEHLPKVWILDNAIGNVCYGSGIGVKAVSKVEDGINNNCLVAVVSLKNELICIGKATMNSDEMIKKERGNILRDVRVFMERGVYPKLLNASSNI
ncbi:MAG: RNA-guided pseudouridylation complex pseudouridine synthase subunit Cbf5 [Candidatus Woesearchaeota archaeon]|nr:MAG: RNA-guided pseudouridylation complex pseudouridine synthase subunit Cbf5 [Candidatus Woesearchaeota archaeon]